MLTSDQLVAGLSVSPLRVGRACLLLLLASFVRFSEYKLCTQTVGRKGGRTVTQVHEKTAHETHKGGPVAP